MTANYRYDVEILHLLVSPAHAYFGRARRGAHLAPLLGGDFALESGGALVRFRAGRPAHPCAWVDRMLAPGAHAAMRGRGGVRCQPLSDGMLHRGPAVLVSPVPLEPALAGTPSLLRPSRLP